MVGAIGTVSPITELTMGLSDEAKGLAIEGIQRVLNQAHFFDQCVEKARVVDVTIKEAVHTRETPCIDTPDCPCCEAVAEEQRVLSAQCRTRALLEGRA